MHDKVVHQISFSSVSFECPMCSKIFKSSKDLEEHIDSNNEQVLQVSLATDRGSDCWTYQTCNICEKQFENESDVEEHKRIEHISINANFSLAKLGITELPYYSKRRRQNF